MPDVVHVHSAPTRDAGDLPRRAAGAGGAAPSLRLVENFDDEHGILDVDRLDEVCPDWKERETWVCGPAPMLEAAEKHWEKRRGWASSCTSSGSPPLSTTRPRAGTSRSPLSGKEADLDGATTMLEAGEAAGIQMPFGCRMGICHTCVVPLKKGMVKDLRNGAEYQENQGVQTCVTAAAGDCVLEI